MFLHVKICDIEALVISGVICWLAILFYLPLFAIVWQLAAGQLSAPEILPSVRNPHWQGVSLGVFCLVMWVSTAYGLHSCWKRPALLTIHPSGSWACRNAFYHPLLRLHPHQPRQVKANLKSWFDQDINETVLSGHVEVLTETAEPIQVPYSGPSLPDGKPALFQQLGYPADFPLITDADGNLVTPIHQWTANGPQLLAEAGVLPPNREHSPD